MKTVAIIDDHDIVRFGLETLVLGCPQLRLVGSAATLAAGLALIAERRPDLVITDLTLPDSGGLDTVRAVVDAQQGRKTLVVSMQDETLYGEQVLALGADGYLMKDNAHAQVIPAALAVLGGHTWASPRLNARMVGRLLRRTRNGEPEPGSPAALQSLSARELEVLQHLKSGRTTKEIAFALGLSVRTVDLHRAHLKKKLGLRTGAELIAFASQRL